MRLIAVLAAIPIAACSPAPDTNAVDSTTPVSAIPALPRLGPTEVDSGPGVKQERSANGVRLVMDPNPGDQINALQPPVIEAANGKRVLFAGTAITKDSLYFVGDVTAEIPAAELPLEGTLTTSYCRKGENLCRSARRQVVVGK